MPAEFRFRPRLWPTVGAAAGIALTLALGHWQLARGHEKSALEARLGALAHEPAIDVTGTKMDAQDVQWHPVRARGRFEPGYVVFIDNRLHHGVPGYQVVMPLRLGDTRRYVLVNRGWIAGNPDRSRLPAVKTPPAEVTVSGLAVVPSKRFLELSTKVTEGKVWQNLTIERYRRAVPIAVQPFLIQQESPLDDGLIREWDPPDLGIAMHYGYAFQWFALSATIFVFYLVTHVKRKRTP